MMLSTQKQKYSRNHIEVSMKSKVIVLGLFIGFYLVHLLLLFSAPTFNAWFLSHGKAELSKYIMTLLPNWMVIARYAWYAWTSWIVVCIIGTPCLGVSMLYEALIE